MRSSESFKDFLGPMLLIIICWGLNFTVIKYALSEIDPIAFRAISGLIGALTIFIISKNPLQLLTIPWRDKRNIIIYSFLTVTLFQSFCTYGISLLPSGRASILAYTMPVWAVILSIFFLKEPLTRQVGVALFFGFLGIIMLIAREFTAIAGNPLGVIFMLLAAVAWATATIIFKKSRFTIPVAAIAFWSLLCGGIPLMLLSIAIENPFQSYSADIWLAIAYNAIVVFVICHLAWFSVLKKIPANISSLATLGVPLVSIVSGFIFLREIPHWTDIAGLALILVSLFIVLAPPRLPEINKAPK